MAVSVTVDSLDNVPEPLRKEYVQKDGKFHLQIDGTPAGFVAAADLATERGRVVEFRDNNIALTKKLADLEPLVKKFEGIDPDAARTAIAEAKALKEKGVTKPDDIATLVNSAVQAAVKPLQDALTETKKETETERARANDASFRSSVGEVFTKAGGQPKALDFILERAKGAFRVVDGKVVAQENRFSASNPGNPLGLDEWLETAAKEYDFAFKPSTGGGAPPAGGGRPGGGRPGQTIIRNPTPQQLGDPEIAAGLKKGTHRLEYDNAAQ